MKSIKPGRGPSFMSGIMGVFIALFGVIWTVLAVKMGGGAFALFGLIFIAIAITMTVFNFKNALSKNRYSSVDIVDGEEEKDPLSARLEEKTEGQTDGGAEKSEETGDRENKFCPYCGVSVGEGYKFCNECGKKLP